MKQIAFPFLLLLIVFGCGTRSISQKEQVGASFSEPRRVLDSIIVVAKTQSLYRENVNWSQLEKEVYKRFTDTDTITSIIEPVQYMLTELGDYHGFLFLNEQRYSGDVPRVRNVDYDYQSQNYVDNVLSLIHI